VPSARQPIYRIRGMHQTKLDNDTTEVVLFLFLSVVDPYAHQTNPHNIPFFLHIIIMAEKRVLLFLIYIVKMRKV